MSLDKWFRKTFYFDQNETKETSNHPELTQIALDQLDRSALHELFEACSDVNIHAYFSSDEPNIPNPVLIYCDGMIDPKQLNDFLYMQLRKLLTDSSPVSGLSGILFHDQNIHRIEEPHAVENMIQQVLTGNLVLYLEQWHSLYTIQMASPPQRAPSESNTEISVKGPRDGFTEAIDTNVALIRKRLKTTTFGIEYFN